MENIDENRNRYDRIFNTLYTLRHPEHRWLVPILGKMPAVGDIFEKVFFMGIPPSGSQISLLSQMTDQVEKQGVEKFKSNLLRLKELSANDNDIAKKAWNEAKKNGFISRTTKYELCQAYQKQC